MSGPSAIEISVRVESDVESGRLAPGQPLPSVRDRARELGVSPATVASAYRRLRDRGLVIGRGRQGTRVAPRSHPAPRFATPLPAGIIDARSGNPDPAFLPPLGRALAHAAPPVPGLYGGSLIDEDLASAARELFEADGVDAAHLAVTSGAMDAIDRVITALDLRTGDRIGVEDPGHTPVHQLARSAGLSVVALPVDEKGIVPGPLGAALDRGLSAVVVTPRAQNPTGGALTAGRASELTAVLADHPEVVLVQDDHAGPVAGVDHVVLVPPGERWATIRSMGKSLGPDLRIAVMVADRCTADRVSTAVGNGPGWISHLLQRVTAYLLTDPTTTELMQAAATSYQVRRARLIEALNAQGMKATGRSGLNVWVPVRDEQTAVEAALAAGYAIRAAATYRISSPPAVRITVAGLTNADIDDLAQALAHDPNVRQTSPPI